MGKTNTIITVTRLTPDGRKYFRSITLPKSAQNVWRAIEDGTAAVLNMDIRKMRSQRLRKGGKR